MVSELEQLVREHWSEWLGGAHLPRQVRFLKSSSTLSERSQAIFFAFSDADENPAFVLRVPRTPAAEARLVEQFGRLATLRTVLPPPLAAAITQPLGIFPIAGQQIGVELAQTGCSMATLTASHRGPIRREFEQAVSWLVDFHSATERPSALEARALRENVLGLREWALSGADLTPGEKQYLDGLVAGAETFLGRLLPFGWRHGDFWPRNILTHNGQLHVVDWEHSREGVLPFSDVLLFPLGYGWALAYGRKMTPTQAFEWTFCQPGFMYDEALRFIRTYCAARTIEASLWGVFAPLALLELELRQSDSQQATRPRLDRFRYLAQHPDALCLL